MIYLDSAATSLQKPPGVSAAMVKAMKTMASPGRGGHRPAMRAADMAFECRQALAALFNLPNPENVVFTMNATHGLNIAINSLVREKDRVVISGYEHNSVLRPLHAAGARIQVAASRLFDPQEAIRAFENHLPGAKVAVCTHVSNVFGFILPIEEIAGLCRVHGVKLIIDASQSAGVIRLDFPALGADFIAFPGHKGLLGPQGTGVLLCRETGTPLMSGGTGSNSALLEMPEFLPDRLEVGTHNITGIAGLLAGVRYVTGLGPKRIMAHERKMLALMSGPLDRVKGLHLYTAADPSRQAGVLSLRSDRISCEALGEALGRRGIAVRAGLHCSPLAHQTAGTMESGTLRFSFSPFNKESEIMKATRTMEDILKKS